MSTALQSDPPRLRKGPKVIRAWADAIADWVRATQPIPGIGVSMNETPRGRLFNARGKSTSSGSVAGTVAFDVLDASDESTAKLRIVLGTVKSGGSLWIPTGMFLGDVTPLIMNAVGTEGVVSLKMTVDGDGDTTAAEIYVGASQPADSSTVGYKLLGTYGTAGDVFSVVSENAGSQSHIFCGLEHFFDASSV